MSIFYIADFEIDLSRSLISKDQQQTQIEPKVLKVLQLLARHQGQVVTHQQIMDEVWSGTEVVPNALQRCIAILRKALEDDAKSPSIIATHPRIGYRLLADVQWQTPVELLPVNTVKPEVQAPSSATKLIPLLTLVLGVLLLSIMISAFWPGKLPSQYTQVQQLTQTDAHESHVLFNPDAEYLVFNRYAGACKSHLWARHNATGKETQLTAQAGYYGATSFTTDGRELVFAAKHNCVQTEIQLALADKEQMCWSLATLDFSQALAAPQQPVFRYQCQAERIEKVKALANHKYAFLQYADGNYQLIQFDDLSKKLSTLYTSDQDYIYHFDYDPKSKRFVVVSRDKALNNILQVIGESGQLSSREPIRLLPQMSRYQTFAANFSPDGQYLLTTSNKQLYRIEFNGQLQPIATPQANLLSAVQHPKQQQLLAVIGNKDIDVAQLSMKSFANSTVDFELNAVPLPFNSFARSTAQDRNARYQPNGDSIGFISDRNGHDQIWLWQNGELSQLNPDSPKQNIHSFSWSPDGKQLAWITNDKLSISNLEGHTQLLRTDKPLYSVLGWYQPNQLLVLLSDPIPNVLYQLDLTSNTLTNLGVNQVENAWVSQDQLLYSTLDGDVYTRPLSKETSQAQLLPELNGKAMVVSDGTIYSVDKQSFELVQYDMQGQKLKTLMPLTGNAWKITDLRNQQLLLSQFIAINQEIVLMR